MDIIIVGAGPSGTSCAFQLKKAGINCLLIDKQAFPRKKVCAGGLTPKAYELINKLYPNLLYDYFKAKEIQLFNSTQNLSTLSLKKEIRIVKREDFDNCLLSQYQEIGGNFIVSNVRKIEEKENKIFLTLHDNTILSCDILIGADGANSVVRRYLQPNYPKGVLIVEEINNDKSLDKIQIFFNTKAQYGYEYIFPNNYGTVRGYPYEKNNTKNKVGLKGAYIPAGNPINYPFVKNIILIGDAGAYTDSITGEGIYYAIKTGENAAFAIIHNVSFKKVNMQIIRKIRTVTFFSLFFYYPIFLRLSLFLCSLKWMKKIMEWLANYSISR